MHIPDIGCDLQKIWEQEGTGPKRVINDSTQDKWVWREIIGVTWEAPERAFYELPAETERNHNLPLTSSQRLPGRGGQPFRNIPGKGVTREEAWA